jgi:hypothetical protein
LALTNTAGAQDTKSGNYYYNGCKSYVQSSGGALFMQGACLGTVGTLMEPENATIGQGVRVVLAYLEKNPAELHQPFVFLATDGLREAWPCKD